MNDSPVEWRSGYEDVKADPRIVKRITQVNDCTVDDLIEWCDQHVLLPEEVRVTAAHLRWLSPETEEEREGRIKWEKIRDESTLRWERETWERLKVKYG